MASYNLSELFELVADAVPERVAVITPARRVTYAQLEERANRLAHHLAGAGIAAGDHVGLQLLNGAEYLEGMLAAFKLRAVPVNVNYRYVERELAQLFEYMDLVALVAHRQFVPSIEAATDAVETLRHVVVVDDGSAVGVPEEWPSYEAALAAASPVRDFAGRASDDLYCACTGGTTGLPKGVMWRQEDIFFVSMGGGDVTRMQGPITRPEQLEERISEPPLVMLQLPPLMHVSAHWGAMSMLFAGSTNVFLTPGALDPAEAWRAIESERVNLVTLVGNAMARPLIEHDAEHPCDASSLFAIASGGAILSASTKARIHELLPNVIILDGFGSTETGFAGTDMTSGKGARATPVFQMDETTTVLDDDLEPLAPGDGRIGQLARRGRIPLGYYKDPEKTAATFVEKDGVRWVLPGDLASIDADGSIVLHGRGSVSINTGGEKVFPEEVESVLVAHPAVADVVVVGVPDERWGQRVVAVVQAKPGRTVELDGLQRFARAHLAGYKLPRSLLSVEEVVRSPSGKPDYKWAADVAAARLQPTASTRRP